MQDKVDRAFVELEFDCVVVGEFELNLVLFGFIQTNLIGSNGLPEMLNQRFRRKNVYLPNEFWPENC